MAKVLAVEETQSTRVEVERGPTQLERGKIALVFHQALGHDGVERYVADVLVEAPQSEDIQLPGAGRVSMGGKRLIEQRSMASEVTHGFLLGRRGTRPGRSLALLKCPLR